MTDPRSILPPAPVAAPSPLSQRGDAKATILDITGSLKSLSRPTQVQGVIAGRNDNGSVVINTDQGQITAIVRSPQPITQGQQVEVDIQPGRPPRQAVIRPADQSTSAPQEAAASPSGSPAPPQPAQASPPETGPQPAIVSQSPADAPSLPLPPEDAPALPPSFTLPPDQSVRLLPLPAGANVLPVPPGQALQEETTQLPLEQLQAVLQSVEDGIPAYPLQNPLQTIPSSPQPLTVLPSSIAAPPLQTLLSALQLPGQGSLTSLPLLPGAFPAGTGTALPPSPPISINLFPAGALNRPSSFADPLPGKPASPLFQEPTAPDKLSLEPLSARLLTEKPPDSSGVISPPSSPRLTRLDVQTINILPGAGRLLTAGGKPVLPAAPSLPAGFAGELDATVEGFTAQGLPVLSLTLPGSNLPQSFILQFNASNLDQGAHVIFMPQPETGTETSLQTAGPSLSGISQDTQWPALQQMMSALNQIAPQAAETLAQILPNPGLPAQLPAAALLFIATVQSGDLGSWLGDKTADLLRKDGKTDLITRLSQDLDTAGRASSEPAPQGWKPAPMPLYYDGQMQKMMLWVRQDGGNGKDTKDKTRQTRFLFDLNLNRMGAVQLDGLAKQQRIDLIVRTVKPVSASMRQIMRQKYLGALEQAAFTGELSFQDRPDQFIKIDGRKTGQALNI